MVRPLALAALVCCAAVSIGAETGPAVRERAPRTESPPAARVPAGAKIGGMDEAGWRARAKKLRTAIARLERDVEQCNRSAPVRWKPGGSRREYDRQVAQANSCQRQVHELEYAQMQLEKLEQNASQQGVPPGWIR